MKKNNIIRTVILSTIIGVLLMFNINQKVENKRVLESKHTVEQALLDRIAYSDSLEAAADSLTFRLDSIDNINDSIDNVIADRDRTIARLKRDKAKVDAEAETLPKDSIYKELVAAYEPDSIVEKPYGFSEPAIRGIYKDYKYGPYQASIIEKQDSTIKDYKRKLDLSQQKNALLAADNDSKTESLNQLMNDLYDANVRIDGNEQEIARLKKILNRWRIGSISAAVAIGLIIAL